MIVLYVVTKTDETNEIRMQSVAQETYWSWNQQDYANALNLF